MTSIQSAGGVTAFGLEADTAVTRIGYGAMQLARPRRLGPVRRPRQRGRRPARGGRSWRELPRHGQRLRPSNGQPAHRRGPPPVPRWADRRKQGGRRPRPGPLLGHRHRPETLRRQVHEALTDLRVPASELTYLRLGGDGQAAPSDVPLEDSLAALMELRDQGLIRRIGLSGADPGQLRRALVMTPIAAVEDRYNLLDRSCAGVLADCEAHGIAFVPYWPLAFGQLAEHADLEAPARRLGATHVQVALAWLLRRSPVVVAIPGTSSVEHVRSNVAVGALAQLLTDDEVTALTALTDESTAALNRPTQSTLDALNDLPVRTASA